MDLKAFVNSDTNVFLTVLVCCFMLYGLTLNNGYSIDDYLVSEDLEMVDKGIRGIPEIVTSYYGKTDLGTPYAYRPVTRVTFALERSLWGERLWLSHLINVLLYAFVCFLSYKLLIIILGQEHRKLVLVAIGLFVFHPIHTEVVCSLKNREELLSLLFVLLSSIFLLRAIDKGGLKFLLLACLLFLLSLPTKVGNVPYAGVLVLGVFLFRKWTTLKLVKAGLPFLLVSAIYGISIFRIFPFYLRQEFTVEESPLMFVPSIWDRIPTGLGIIPYYLKMVSLPHPLAFFYGYDQIKIMDWNDGLVWLGVLILIGMLAAFFLCLKKAPVISFGIGIFGMGISPFLNIIAGVPGIIAERWMLTPSIGFCLILSWLHLRLYTNFGRREFLAALFLILCLYSLRTVSRIPDWKSHRSLVYHDVQVVPKSFVANFLAAKFYSIDGYETESPKEREDLLNHSLFYYDALIPIARNKAEYQLRCAYLCRDLGKNDLAVNYANGSFHHREGRVKYGLKSLELLLQLGTVTTGTESAQTLVNEFPDQSAPLIFLGNFHLMAGDSVKAVQEYRKALNLPDVDQNFPAFVQQLEAQLSE